MRAYGRGLIKFSETWDTKAHFLSRFMLLVLLLFYCFVIVFNLWLFVHVCAQSCISCMLCTLHMLCSKLIFNFFLICVSHRI